MSLPEDIANQFAKHSVLKEITVEITKHSSADMFQFMKKVIEECQSRKVRLRGIIADITMDRMGRQGYTYNDVEIIVKCEPFDRSEDAFDCLKILRL
jgi:hypothetical protein